MEASISRRTLPSEVKFVDDREMDVIDGAHRQSPLMSVRGQTFSRTRNFRIDASISCRL
jgi:hypothetical protein